MSHPWLAVSFQLRHEVSGILSIQSHFNVGYPVSTSWGLVSSKWGFESQNAWLLTLSFDTMPTFGIASVQWLDNRFFMVGDKVAWLDAIFNCGFMKGR